jgi:hypothetical protein
MKDCKKCMRVKVMTMNGQFTTGCTHPDWAGCAVDHAKPPCGGIKFLPAHVNFEDKVKIAERLVA